MALLQFFVYFVPLVMEKVVLVSESLFLPANGVRSTRLLVEIHNIHGDHSMFPTSSEQAQTCSIASMQ